MTFLLVHFNKAFGVIAPDQFLTLDNFRSARFQPGQPRPGVHLQAEQLFRAPRPGLSSAVRDGGGPSGGPRGGGQEEGGAGD